MSQSLRKSGLCRPYANLLLEAANGCRNPFVNQVFVVIVGMQGVSDRQGFVAIPS